MQINQMVQFIKKEAEEKSNEIKAAAQEVRRFVWALSSTSMARGGLQCVHSNLVNSTQLTRGGTCTVQEYTIQKQTMVEAEKAKIRKEYERKRSQIETKKKM